MADDTHQTRGLLWTARDPQALGPDEASVRRELSNLEFSREAGFMVAVLDIMNRKLGYERSLRTGESVLGDGQPIPLMSYGLVEYLLSLDLSLSTVLELGGGQSTLFWSSKARSVHTLEHDREWLAAIARQQPGNVRVTEVRQEGYAEAIAALPDYYDIVVIDCGANRYECAKAIGPRLRRGGIVVLDNSDWYPNAAGCLRDLDLIQVDFPDFRPSHHFRCTTSIFLHREFRPVGAGARHPPIPLGGKDIAPVNRWDDPAGT